VCVGSTGQAIFSIYLYANIIIGNWVLLNLFIAILIGKFSEQRNQALEQNLDTMQDRLLEKLGDLTDSGLAIMIQNLFNEIDLDGSGEIDKYEFNEALVNLGVQLKPREIANLVAEVDKDGSGTISFPEFMQMIKSLLAKARVHVDQRKLDEDMATAQGNMDEQLQNKPDVEERLPRTCCCLEQENHLRRACLILGNEDASAFGGGWKGSIGPLFGNFILVCILMSTVQLAIFTPYTGEVSEMTDMLNLIDYVLNVVFTIELCAKLVAMGWKIFIQSGWNKLDLFIVTTSDADMILTEALKGSDIPLSALRIFRVFRIFRALRPLRIIARARGVRLLVQALSQAIKPVSVTLAIAVVALFVLGIFFVQFMGGRMRACSDRGLFTKPDCVGLDDNGVPRVWGPGPFNFDNVWNAFVAMFILSSQDDWPSHMFAAMDGTGPLTGRKNNGGSLNNVLAPFFCVVALLVTSSIVINMFVGVFVDCYYSAMAEVDSDSSKKDALDPKKLRAIVFYEDPTVREHGLRGHVFETITHSKFDMFIAFFIITNVLSMATESLKPSTAQLAFDEWANYFYTYVFGCEKIFKLFVLRPRRYFVDGWNKFDTFIVHISFVGMVIESAASSLGIEPSVLRILRIMRIFRILRAFRILKSLKELQQIVQALGRSAGQVGNLTLLLMLLFFIFGVLAVNLGGGMCVMGDEAPPTDVLANHPLYGVRCAITSGAAHLEPHGHYQAVGVALLSLWRISTSDGWGDMMSAVSIVPGNRVLSSGLKESYLAVFGEEYRPDAFKLHFDEGIAKFLNTRIEKEGFKGEHASSMRIAMKALVEFNNTAMGSGGYDEAQLLLLASIALPECLQEDEANFLSLVGLIDCTIIGDGFSSGPKLCPGSCGFNFAGLFYSPMVAKIYFILFVSTSQFVLLQLVIAVLMDQLGAAQEEDNKEYVDKAPGCEHLTIAVFKRAFRRFEANARLKVLQQRAQVGQGTQSTRDLTRTPTLTNTPTHSHPNTLTHTNIPHPHPLTHTHPHAHPHTLCTSLPNVNF
jgi:hypothetical protein